MTKHVMLLGLLVHASAHASERDPEKVKFFESRIRPVLATHCYQCHSAEIAQPKAALRLDSRASMLKGGVRGAAVLPGKPDESLLIGAISHDEAAELQMPPKGKLPVTAIADLRTWIQWGAPWPASATANDSRASTRAGQAADGLRRMSTHWSFRPLSPPPIPKVQQEEWVQTPIDAFVLAKLEAAGVAPARPASRRTLLRRIYLDLIGLPPTPQEQREFLADTSPRALAKLVDRLLSLPQYGERWGRHWLDVVRFAESRGYERDEPKPHAWRYRDYVITALNEDKPYDRQVLEQLAGDELPDADAASRTAVSFLRLGAFDTIAADEKLARYDQLDDVLGTAAAAFLGQTIRCARCHDHKFEPYSQENYYQLLAVFDPLSGERSDAVHVGSDAELESYQAAQSSIDARIAPLEEKRDRVLAAILEQWLADAGQSGAANQRTRRRFSPELVAALRKPISQRSKRESSLVTRRRRRIDDAARPRATADQQRQLRELDDRIRWLDRQRPWGQFAYVFSEASTTPPPTHVFLRGDVHRAGEEVEPAIPSFLPGSDVSPPAPTATTSGRRLWLARWMTGPGRGLVARVMVNRIWQYHFGSGIAATPNDLGLQGDPPTHPELLEWLANQFVTGGWSIKRMHRLIVLSSVYQTAAVAREDAASADGRLFERWHTRRLEAETVRDSVLAVSGRINLEMLGPSVFPPLTEKLVGASAGLEWKLPVRLRHLGGASMSMSSATFHFPSWR